MKALLISLSIPFPKVHDLRKLFDLMPDSAKNVFNLEDLLLVNRYAIDARYPGDYDLFQREDAARSAKIAKEIKAKISSRLPQS